jgi:hypothetical protein
VYTVEQRNLEVEAIQFILGRKNHEIRRNLGQAASRERELEARPIKVGE